MRRFGTLDANREVRWQKENYRSYLDYRDRRAEFIQELRRVESMGKPLSTWEAQILAEEEGR